MFYIESIVCVDNRFRFGKYDKSEKYLASETTIASGCSYLISGMTSDVDVLVTTFAFSALNPTDPSVLELFSFRNFNVGISRQGN